MSFLARRSFTAAVAGSLISLVVASQAVAGPMMATPSTELGLKSNVTEIRSVHRRAARGGNGAAAAAVMGLFALGVGAAIANSQREAYYESRPAYGYNYGPSYAYGPAYVEQPQYYYPQPYAYPRHRNDGTYWQQLERDRRDRESQ